MRAPTATSGAGCRFDRGFNVKARQLLAEIETPEVDQQLAGSRTVCHRTQRTTSSPNRQPNAGRIFVKLTRYLSQETDEKVGDMDRRVPQWKPPDETGALLVTNSFDCRVSIA